MHIVCEEFQHNAKKVEECAEILKQETDSIKEYMEALSAKCEEVETTLNHMKKQLQVISELYEPLRNSRKEINTHFTDVKKQMTEINNLQQGSDVNFIRKINECRRSCDCVMNDTQVILNRKITIPENIKQNIETVGGVGQLKTMEVSLKEKLLAKTQQRQNGKNNELNNLELLSEIKPVETVYMIKPLEVVSVGDGTVILVDSRLNYLQRINTEGELVRKYQVTISKHVTYRNTCVYGNCLFVLKSDNVITKISLDGSDRSVKCKPVGVGTIYYISAIRDNVILILEIDGRILEYNIETNQVIQRVSGVLNPWKVYVVQDGHDTKYIVKTFRYKYILKIYNRAWNLISTIDMYTDVLTVTPGGKLLIVNDNRIHEYSQDGTYIRELLGKYKFNKIRDITMSGGCLWVLEVNPCCIKIFVAN